jgi:hypothetical protein
MKMCIDCKNYFKNEKSEKSECTRHDIVGAVSRNFSIMLEDAEYEVHKWLQNADDENNCPEFSD